MITYNTSSGSIDSLSGSRVKVPHIGPRPRDTKPVIPTKSNPLPLVNIKK